MIDHHTTKKSDDIEKDNLEAHVEICGHRYRAIERRLAQAEAEIDELNRMRSQSREQTIKAIGVATAVMSLTVSLTMIFLDRIG